MVYSFGNEILNNVVLNIQFLLYFVSFDKFRFDLCLRARQKYTICVWPNVCPSVNVQLTSTHTHAQCTQGKWGNKTKSINDPSLCLQSYVCKSCQCTNMIHRLIDSGYTYVRTQYWTLQHSYTFVVHLSTYQCASTKFIMEVINFLRIFRARQQYYLLMPCSTKLHSHMRRYVERRPICIASFNVPAEMYTNAHTYTHWLQSYQINYAILINCDQRAHANNRHNT